MAVERLEASPAKLLWYEAFWGSIAELGLGFYLVVYMRNVRWT